MDNVELVFKYHHFRIHPFMPQPDKGRPLESTLISPRLIKQIKKDYKDWNITTPVRGGLTLCEVYAKSSVIGTGKAWCSNSDVFVVSKGRAIAKERALMSVLKNITRSADIVADQARYVLEREFGITEKEISE